MGRRYIDKIRSSLDSLNSQLALSFSSWRPDAAYLLKRRDEKRRVHMAAPKTDEDSFTSLGLCYKIADAQAPVTETPAMKVATAVTIASVPPATRSNSSSESSFTVAGRGRDRKMQRVGVLFVSKDFHLRRQLLSRMALESLWDR